MPAPEPMGPHISVFFTNSPYRRCGRKPNIPDTMDCRRGKRSALDTAAFKIHKDFRGFHMLATAKKKGVWGSQSHFTRIQGRGEWRGGGLQPNSVSTQPLHLDVNPHTILQLRSCHPDTCAQERASVGKNRVTVNSN